MKYRIFYGIMLSLLFSGCLNNGFIEVRGKILDEKTHEFVANRKIIVHELRDRENDKGFSIIGEFKTDSLGQFAYMLRKSEVTYFYNFEIMGDSVYNVSNNILGMTELNQNGKFLTLYMNKLTRLTLKIERKSRTAFQDTLFVSWVTNHADGEILYPYKVTHFGVGTTVPLRWIGGNVRSVVNTKVYADKKTIIRWKLFRQGHQTEFTDTVFCQRDAANSISFRY